MGGPEDLFLIDRTYKLSRYLTGVNSHFKLQVSGDTEPITVLFCSFNQ